MATERLPVKLARCVLKVSESGYYARRRWLSAAMIVRSAMVN